MDTRVLVKIDSVPDLHLTRSLYEREDFVKTGVRSESGREQIARPSTTIEAGRRVRRVAERWIECHVVVRRFVGRMIEWVEKLSVEEKRESHRTAPGRQTNHFAPSEQGNESALEILCNLPTLYRCAGIV